MVLDRDVVTTDHQQEVILVYDLISAIVMTLSVPEGHSLLQTFLSVIFHICGVSCGPFVHAELLVHNGLCGGMIYCSSLAAMLCMS